MSKETTTDTTKLDVSSAEITSVYRCVHPELSGDRLSCQLTSEPGQARASAFIEKYDYPLVTRKISVCAGYLKQEAARLLHSRKYDSCISFASGFSFLTYSIAEECKSIHSIQYFDTDFPHMILERQRRIEAIQKTDILNKQALEKIQLQAFDIEQAYRQNRNLKIEFPNCHRPIFILDGVQYFLSPECAKWLIAQMGSYPESAVMLYYWPDNMLRTSTLFARVFGDLNKGMILEELKSFWDASMLEYFRRQFPKTTDLSLAEAEMILCENAGVIPILKNLNDYFPVRLIVGEK